jgi:hypothetical protein
VQTEAALEALNLALTINPACSEALVNSGAYLQVPGATHSRSSRSRCRWVGLEPRNTDGGDMHDLGGGIPHAVTSAAVAYHFSVLTAPSPRRPCLQNHGDAAGAKAFFEKVRATHPSRQGPKAFFETALCSNTRQPPDVLTRQPPSPQRCEPPSSLPGLRREALLLTRQPP